MKLSEVILEYDDDRLIRYLQEEIENKGKQKEVMQMMKWLYDPDHDEKPCTLLQFALYHNKSKEVIFKLIEIGGRELINVKHIEGSSALFAACENENPSLDIVLKLINVGGRELVMMRDTCAFFAGGGSVLHTACRNKNISLEIISKLIEVGGRELVMMKDTGNIFGPEETALHIACRRTDAASLDIINKLIEVGGRELVMIANSAEGGTALHDACGNENASLDVISKLLEVGGKELVMERNYFEISALHAACRNKNRSLEIIPKLLEIGGSELVMMEDKDGCTALHFGYFNKRRNDTPFYNESFQLMVKESILSNIGGEFGIGGLFNVSNQEVQNKIYERWEELSPALKSAVESLHDQQQPPILHTAILSKAPLHVITDITNQFEYSVLKNDSLNRYPIEIALKEGLGWNDGLQQVVESTAVVQEQHTPIYTAAKYGLKWAHHMKELTEANIDEMMNGRDSVTGLCLFMVAAMGDYHDLSGIYGMMRMSPETSKQAMCLDDCSTTYIKKRRFLK